MHTLLVLWFQATKDIQVMFFNEPLLTSLVKSSIVNKISTIVIDKGSNNVAMLNSFDNDTRGVPGVKKALLKYDAKIRVFQDVMIGLEKSEKLLLSRIDDQLSS